MSDAARSDLVLCAGTLLRASLRELAAAAQAGGFGAVSLWPHHVEGARRDGLSDEGIRALLADHELVLCEVEPLLAWLPPGSLPESARALAGPPPEFFLDLACALGAPRVLCADGFGARASRGAIVEHFARVCEAAAARGLVVALEAIPWSAVPDARAAWEIARATGQRNAGMCLDVWHFFRGGAPLAQLAELPGERVLSLQLSDAPAAPWADLPQESLRARLLPGEGAIDLVAFLRALDSIGCRAPLGAEVFSETLAAQDPVAVGRLAGDALRRVMRSAATA
ncbi:MAG TPA: sugar phosphate isomerase/epimerase family protein [Myxococcota bacterium]|nr:sugar phosphate isomerase/epimerase family protein [Myxococcota bacterium]